MIHYGTMILNGKSERPGGTKVGASGDLDDLGDLDINGVVTVWDNYFLFFGRPILVFIASL